MAESNSSRESDRKRDRKRNPNRTPKRNTDPRRAKVYLDRVLSLDPTTNASLMVEFRWRFCELGTDRSAVGGKAVDPAQVAQRRQAAEERLEKVRAHFWRASAEQLEKSLSAIPVEEFADLKGGVDRLRGLVLCREEMERLSQHPNREINLYNNFRRIVMLSPRKAGTVKEKYLRDFAFSENRKQVLKMIKTMRSEFPELIAIEADWFNQIGRIKNRGTSGVSSAGGGGGFSLEVPGWMIGIAIYVIFKMLLLCF